MSIKQIYPQENLSSQPLVSFIVTTYNLPVDYILECIRSIVTLSLRPQDREIIIIDDGSDVSPINDILDIRNDIIYIRQRNQGLSAARNAGIRIASGAYIQFIDGDDTLIHTPYEHCLDIVRYHTPDIVLFNCTDKPNAETPMNFEGPISGTEYMHNNNLRASACGYIFSKNILLNLRFTIGILHEDEEFTPQLMLRAEHVFETNADAYYYRQREPSITHDKNIRHKIRRINDTEHILYHLQDISFTLPEIDRIALERRIAQLTMDYLYNIIDLTHSIHQLNKSIERLTKHGLYPLPDKKYTKKYTVFRRMIQNNIGRKLLIFGIRKFK